MTAKNYPLTATISGLLCILLAIGTATIFKPCPMGEDGSWMRCHETQTLVIIFAGAMAILLGGAMFTSQKTLLTIIYIICSITAAVIVFLPNIIMEMCSDRTMRCFTHMQPFVRILGGIIFTICFDKTVQLLKKK